MTTKIIDTHIHLDVDDYRDDLDEVIARAKAAGVSKVFIPAIDEPSGDAALLLAQRYPNDGFASRRGEGRLCGGAETHETAV